MILEAYCTRCGETFNPHGETPADLEHFAREDGTECGGRGELRGAWAQNRTEADALAAAGALPACDVCDSTGEHAADCSENTGPQS